MLFSPSGAPDAYYAEFGWVPSPAATEKSARTGYGLDAGRQRCAVVDHPVTLTYDNGEGLVFRRTIAVDDHYLFTLKDEVANKGGSPVTLFPYAPDLAPRHAEDARLLHPA